MNKERENGSSPHRWSLHHPLPLSPSVSVWQRVVSWAEQRPIRRERQRAKENEEGEAVPLLLLLLPECFATAASRLTGLSRESHTFGLLSFWGPLLSFSGNQRGSAASHTHTVGVIYTLLGPVPTVRAFLLAEHHFSRGQMCTRRCFGMSCSCPEASFTAEICVSIMFIKKANFFMLRYDEQHHYQCWLK